MIHSIQVCLVSDQTLQNLIPVLMYQPQIVHLVVSKDMEKKGVHQRLGNLLQQKTIDCVFHSGSPSAGLDQLVKYAKQVITSLKKDYREETSISFNCTGGTKLMSLAFVRAFEEDLPQAKILYTDTDHDVIEYLHPQPGSEPMQDVLDVKTYLEAQGFTVETVDSAQTDWQKTAQEREPLTRWLAENADKMGDFIGALNGLASQASNNKLEQFFDKLPKNRWKPALQKIRKYRLLDWKEGERKILFKDENARLYLNGHWLEEYAWQVVKSLEIKDVQAGVRVLNGTISNEFDVLVVHRNRLLCIECKTSKFGDRENKDQDIIHKLDSLGSKIKGLFGDTWLVSARSLPDRAREHAQTNRIQVIETLSGLDQKIAEWMRPKNTL